MLGCYSHSKLLHSQEGAPAPQDMYILCDLTNDKLSLYYSCLQTKVKIAAASENICGAVLSGLKEYLRTYMQTEFAYQDVAEVLQQLRCSSHRKQGFSLNTSSTKVNSSNSLAPASGSTTLKQFSLPIRQFFKQRLWSARRQPLELVLQPRSPLASARPADSRSD